MCALIMEKNNAVSISRGGESKQTSNQLQSAINDDNFQKTCSISCVCVCGNMQLQKQSPN